MVTSAPALPNKSVSEVVLLDTNVLIIYARDGEPAKQLERIIGLQSGSIEAVASVVTIGEAFAFGKKANWGDARLEKLRELVRTKMVPVDINRPEILVAYAEIDHYCEKVAKPARPIGQNDLWIAATARVLNCTLITTDKDFDHLHDTMLRRQWIDPESLKPKAGPANPIE